MQTPKAISCKNKFLLPNHPPSPSCSASLLPPGFPSAQQRARGRRADSVCLACYYWSLGPREASKGHKPSDVAISISWDALALPVPQETPRPWKHRTVSFMFWELIWSPLSRASACSPQPASVRQQAAQFCFIQPVGGHDVLQLLSVAHQVLHEVGHPGIVQHPMGPQVVYVLIGHLQEGSWASRGARGSHDFQVAGPSSLPMAHCPLLLECLPFPSGSILNVIYPKA